MTVQEWVAALPTHESHTDEDHGEDHHRDSDEDQDKPEPSDQIRLGEEASYFVPGGVKNFGQLLLQKNNKSIRFEKYCICAYSPRFLIFFQVLSPTF